MEKESRKVVLYIACSLDGFIATPNHQLDFLDLVAKVGEDYGYAQFQETVDTVIMGRKTYDKVLSLGVELPHAHKNTYILTRQPRPNKGHIQFYSGPVNALIQKLKAENGLNIFCDGGAETANELLRHNLIDEFIISIIPILLGRGIKLFYQHRPELRLNLLSCQTFQSGLVQLHYQKPINQTPKP